MDRLCAHAGEFLVWPYQIKLEIEMRQLEPCAHEPSPALYYHICKRLLRLCTGGAMYGHGVAARWAFGLAISEPSCVQGPMESQ